ncbi:trypsin-like serine peptidase [Kitasatospora sp. NPDC101801]|uniref:trypsin-like serine peptidase n=1 Tax=Kitasatospora sp. NPDC101801 TaxID=3364103 RepID=UPI00380EDC93
MTTAHRLAVGTLIAALVAVSPAAARSTTPSSARRAGPSAAPAPVVPPVAESPVAPPPAAAPVPTADPAPAAVVPPDAPVPVDGDDDADEDTADDPAPAAAPVAAAPSPSRKPSAPAPSSAPVPSATPTPSATLPSGLGTTATAPATTESARVGALFTDGHHFCTASVVDSPSGTFALTAAHCLSSATGVTFAPGYRNGSAPYGTWQVTAVHTSEGWQQDRDPDEDYALLEIAPDAGGRTVQATVGGNPIGFGASPTATARLYGYPSRSDAPILCTAPTTAQSAHQRRIDCPDFPGGTSGGPFVEAGTGHVIGVIGGYQEGGDTEDISYAATFGDTLAALFTKATTG